MRKCPENDDSNLNSDAQIGETDVQDACLVEVTNRHLKPICPALEASCIRQYPFIDEIMKTPYRKGEGGESEPFCSFLMWFLDIFMKIRNLNLKVTFHSIIMALKLRSFSDGLCKLLPKGLRIERVRHESRKETQRFEKVRIHHHLRYL
ncbi:hypothetical protein CR513_38934, partial [Mucuna pruriens]